MHTKTLKYKGNTILIGRYCLKKIGKKFFNKNLNESNIIIIDSKVYKFHKKYLLNSLKNFEKKIILFNSFEKKKSIKGFENLINKIFLLKPDRNTRIILIGGGVLGDLGGFISSTLLRGVKLILVPTTLLSQADSSIGGKNGINNKFGKNLIGTFYNPNFIFIDTHFLNSLSKRELKSGYAEILKHSIIKDKKFFYWLEKYYKKIIELKEPYISKAIYKSVKIKTLIVKDDEKENKNIKNSRILLNFGHTIAHAIESRNKYKNNLKHGEAVLIGMNYAAKISNILKYLNKNKVSKIEDHLIKYNLHYKLKNIKLINLLEFIKQDKKNKNNLIRLVLLKDLGKAFVSKYYPATEIKKIFDKINS